MKLEAIMEFTSSSSNAHVEDHSCHLNKRKAKDTFLKEIDWEVLTDPKCHS